MLIDADPFRGRALRRVRRSALAVVGSAALTAGLFVLALVRVLGPARWAPCLALVVGGCLLLAPALRSAPHRRRTGTAALITALVVLGIGAWLSTQIEWEVFSCGRSSAAGSYMASTPPIPYWRGTTLSGQVSCDSTRMTTYHVERLP